MEQHVLFVWKDFSRFVEVSPVDRGWLVIWGRYLDQGRVRATAGNRTYLDLNGVRRRLGDAVFELTNNPTLVAEALVRRPGRHLALGDACLDRAGPRPDLGVAGQRHRTAGTGPVAGGALGIEDGRDILVIGGRFVTRRTCRARRVETDRHAERCHRRDPAEHERPPQTAIEQPLHHHSSCQELTVAWVAPFGGVAFYHSAR